MNINNPKRLSNTIRNLSGSPYKRGRLFPFAQWARISASEEIKHELIDGRVVKEIRNGEKYVNHIEMAGIKSAVIVSYGVSSKGNLRLLRHCIFPALRLNPNDTHAHFDNNFSGVSISINGVIIEEKVSKFIFDGMLIIESKMEDFTITRTLYPGNLDMAVYEKVVIKNHTILDIDVKIINQDSLMTTHANMSATGDSFEVYTKIDVTEKHVSAKSESVFNVAYASHKKDNRPIFDYKGEFQFRHAYLSKMANIVNVITPNGHINEMTKYAKIRASESIFETKAGLMHSPGGGGYYAAIWTNDQCEYVNPLFGYMGYSTGCEQSENCYNMYKKYISDNKALITSIIAEGDGIWHGAKDRGDSAMYAYGCSRYLLSIGNKEFAKNYIKYIESCITYELTQIGKEGVVRSDSDELENRFKSGKYNLCTNCLTYDALVNASYLERDLGNQTMADHYSSKAIELRANIIKYFGAKVEGYDTFRYCDTESSLRSWICMPMSVGIYDKSDGTVSALLSDKLRKASGLLTKSGANTFWDRSALYALKGMFKAGYTSEGIELLSSYSKTRLLGNHIPYAIEAFPEGNQAQLSAESGLYVRIITEGILGLDFVGLGKFVINPNLPTNWPYIIIDKINIAGADIDIKVTRTDNSYDIKCVCNGKELLHDNGVYNALTITNTIR